MGPDGTNLEANERIKGTVGISLAVLFWGFGYVNAKFAVAEIEPFALMQFRNAFSTIIILIIVKLSGRELLSHLRKEWRRVLPLSVLGILINQLCFLWGMKYTTPSHAALMYTLMPIISAIFAVFLIGERINAVRWIGILIAFSGAVLLVTGGKLDFSNKYFLGDLIVLGAVTAFALFVVIAKPVLAQLGVLRTVGITYLLSAAIVPVFCAVPAYNQDWGNVTAIAWGSALYLVLFSTVGAYLCHQYALKRLSATIVAAFAYTQPVIAAFFSVLILGEELTPVFFISAALILTGIIIARRRVEGAPATVVPSQEAGIQ